MTRPKRRYYILNYVFLIGILLLCLNDHILKWEYSNWITGKLSDFIGVFLLPLLLTYFFPKRIKFNVIATVLFFVFWKSEFSQSFIDFYNKIALIKIIRVVDYSDLIALIMVPLSLVFIKRLSGLRFFYIGLYRLNPIAILIPTAIIFMATSPPYNYRFSYSNGELVCNGCSQTVKMSKYRVLQSLEENDYIVKTDSMQHEKGYRFQGYWRDSVGNFIESYPYYIIDEIIIGQDTITDFQFALESVSENKTKIWINGMNISEDIPDNKVRNELRKYYRNLIRNHFKIIILRKE